MKIIIAGAGEVGTYLAKMLSAGEHDIIVIDDKHSENLKLLDSRYDLLTYDAYPASIGQLKEANIKKCDLFIAVTPYETENITSCIIAKQLGAKKTVARIDNREYILENNQLFFEGLGVDSLIYPEKLAAEEIQNLLQWSNATNIFDFSKGKLSIVAFRLNENAQMINKTLEEFSSEKDMSNYRVIAITRESKTIIPTGSDTFQINDLIYIISNQDGFDMVKKYSGKTEVAIKNVMILGGSKIGKKTAKLLEHHFNVKLLEANKERCFELADFLDNTLVVNADGRNVNVLIEEGISKMDAFIAVTGNSETNILSCMLAKKYNVERTIAEIENMDFIDLAGNMGIETVINKKLIAVSHIHRFTTKAKISAVQCLTGTEAEVMEFVVQKGSKVTRSLVSELDFPKGAIIGGVVRGKKAFVAKGDCQINEGDTVVVFALQEAIKRLPRYFS